MRDPSSSSATARGRSGGGAPKKPATATPCCNKVGLKRGPWTAEEDEVLAGYIGKEGAGRWRTLPKRAGLLRCGKSCRLRWMNYLRPSVKRGQIGADEEDLILRLHRLLGNRWSLIAGRIPGRTDNEIKNYWNTHLSKKLISQGIDPRTHRPFSSNPSSSIHNNKVAIASPPHAPLSSPSTPPFPSPTFPILAPTPSPPLVPVGHRRFEIRGYFGGGLDSIAGGGTANSRDPEGGEEGDISRGSADDAISSFLNSLINEDAFCSASHQQQLSFSSAIDGAPASTCFDDALMFSPSAQQAFGLGPIGVPAAAAAAAMLSSFSPTDDLHSIVTKNDQQPQDKPRF